MANKNITAAYIVIGNEVLSGRTKDKNINFLAKFLIKLGINLEEVRIIPDEEKAIIKTVNELRKKFTYVFTTGGIGPTHDDITTESIAKALNKKLFRDENAVNSIKIGFHENDVGNLKINLKMADVPVGSTLIHNAISGAPGYMVENVVVMAGVPKIMHSMLSDVKKYLDRGDKIISKEIKINFPESVLSKKMDEIQKKYYKLSIGSYPLYKNVGQSTIFYGTAIVFKGTNKKDIENAYAEIINFANNI